MCVECLCGVRRQEIVVINGMILFSYADYKMIVKLHPGALSVFYPPNQYKNRIDYPPLVINT